MTFSREDLANMPPHVKTAVDALLGGVFYLTRMAVIGWGVAVVELLVIFALLIWL